MRDLILIHFCFQDDIFNSILDYMESQSEWEIPLSYRINNVQRLLSTLQNHIMAHYLSIFKNNPVDSQQYDLDDILIIHLSHICDASVDILNRAATILENFPSSLKLLCDVLLNSVAGGMLFKMLNSLLLMPTTYLIKIYHLLQKLMEPINKVTNLLPAELIIDTDKESLSK